MKDQEARLWRHIEPEPMSGCWLWIGAATDGYAQMTEGGRTRLVHRLLYTRYIGPVPVGLELDHLCRVRCCVNPKHLDPVTKQINILRGANTRLAADQIDEIRRLVAAGGHRQVDVAAQFGVTQAYVSKVARRVARIA